MSRTKGSAKTGGREPGSKNKVQADIKIRLMGIVEKYVLNDSGIKSLEADLDVLRPVDRVTMIEKLMKYCIPTLGTVQMTDGDGEPVTIKVQYVQSTPKNDEEDEADGQDYSIKIDGVTD